MLRSQLGGWACQARPLRLFRSAQRFVFEVSVEGVTRFEDLVDDAGDLERDEGAGNLDGFASRFGFKEGADLGIVLHGPDGGVTERDFEIAVPGFGTGAMLGPPSGVGGSRHEPAIGKELLGGGEAFDPIDLGVDREGVDLADARDPEQALDMGIGNEIVVERSFEGVYLFLDERDLCAVAGRLEVVEVIQLVHGLDVELLEEPCDAVFAASSFFDESEASAHEVSRCAVFGTNHVRLGDEVGTQKKRQDVGVDLIGFDFGR